MKTLIIIPAYNESKNIADVVKNIQQKCPDCDYIIINDCSTDETPVICDQSNFNHLDLCCNLGIGGGVQSGYLFAEKYGYDCAIQIDGDGQHDPAFIPEITKPIESGEADVVIGSRFIENEGFQSSGMRRFGIRFLSKLIKLVCKADVKDVTSGFRAVNRRFIEIFAHDYADDYPEPEAIVSTVLNGGKIKEIPVIMHERTGGVSSISPLKSVYYMIKVSLSILLFRITFKGGEKR